MRLPGLRWRFGAIVFALLCQHPALLPARTTASRPVLVGYFPQWGVYSKYFVKNLVASGGAGLLDQIDYSQGVIANSRCAIGDPNADLNFVHSDGNSLDGKTDDAASPLKGNFHQLQELRHLYPKLKILISIEGKAEGFATAARPENRAAFVSSCVDMFIRGHLAPDVVAAGLFDGFDIDWEYPETADRENYSALLAEFRQQMDAVHPGLKLAVATGAGLGHYQGINLRQVAGLVDQIGVMNYDYNGPWNRKTGILAPLFEVAGDPLRGNTVDATIRGYEEAGVPPAKLLMGIPFYAYGWDGVADLNHGLFQAGEPIRGDHFYSYIQTIQPKFQLYRDPESKAPWLFDGKSFWSFDDAISIRAKLEYAKKQKLGGVMVWELSNDSADAGLLKAIAGNLHWKLGKN